MTLLTKTYKLTNSVLIPKIGFGTAPLKGKDAYNAIKTAIDVGYRHIDTAQNYGNEHEVGRAIKDSGIDREAFFITSKLRAEIKSYDEALVAFHETLKALDTDYVDLFIIHAPWPWNEKYSDYSSGNISAYKALETLYNESKVKAIGVSNFDHHDLENIVKNCDIVPHVNQIKFHIGHTQTKTVAYCKEHSILVEAYSPLGRGGTLDNETIKTIANKYNVSPAQVCIRYILDKNILPLPRSSNPVNIKANANVDFTLSKDDIMTLDHLTIETIEFGTPAKK